MKIIHVLIILSTSLKAYDQALENKRSLSILIGAKIRVTPIYLERVPDVISSPLNDILEQPDKHLSGPGIHITEKYRTATKWSFALHQTVRYDYIYQKLPLEYPTPPGFEATIKQKLLFDLYTDVAKDITAKNSTFRIMIGFAVCGLNSGFTQTFRIYQGQNNYTDYYKEKNFIFPAATAGVGWQKNRIYGELKFGYCWDNPTLFNTPFLFPEISIQYQVFNHDINK